MTLTQAAEYLGVTRATLRRWVEKHKLNAVPDPMDDRRKLILVSDLDELRRRAEALH